MKVQRMYEAKMVLVEYVSSSWIFRGQKNTHFAKVDKNLATFWLITSNVAFGCCCCCWNIDMNKKGWQHLYSSKLRDLCWMKLEHFKICKKNPNWNTKHLKHYNYYYRGPGNKLLSCIRPIITKPNEKRKMTFIFHYYCKISSISMQHFIQHKYLIMLVVSCWVKNGFNFEKVRNIFLICIRF